MKLLTKEQQNHIKMQKSVTFIKKNSKINMRKKKIYHKIRDHCHYIEDYRSTAHKWI